MIFQSGHNTLSRQLFVKLILSSESFFGTKKKKKRNWQKREYRKIDNNNISSFETKKYSLSLHSFLFFFLFRSSRKIKDRIAKEEARIQG